MNIHFFRKSALEKLDYEKILDFFDQQQNFEIYYTTEQEKESYVEILYKDHDFGFEYRYYITDRSRVSKIYDLSPVYSNAKFFLEMPIMIPSFLAKEMLMIIQKLCREFDLGVYHESFDDVVPFNMVEFLAFFEKQRAQCIQEFGMQDKMYYDEEKLNIICKFQRSVNRLSDYYHNEVTVNSCYPIVDNVNGDSGMCYDWKFGTPIIFAPHVDYILIQDEETGRMLVRRDELFGILDKYISEIKNFLPDLYILKAKQAKKCRKEMKKIKKIVMDKNYKVLKLCDVIGR